MIAPIAVSCGDPAGIGPEIAVAARALAPEVAFAILGDPRHFAPAAAQAGVRLAEIDHIGDAARTPGLAILPMDFAAAAVPGKPDHRNAAGTIASIDRAVAATQTGEAGAVCTLPIAKSVLIRGAGFAHPGHTEYLAHLGGVPRSVMLLTAPEMSVVPVTIHIPLAEVPDALTTAALEDTLRITRAAFQRDFAVAEPRIAVAGLNPHAGEAGLIGSEDRDLIAPVLARLRDEGWQIAGPLPADTMFHPAARATYDVAVMMYHDQALIPIKTLNFAEGVNVTLGLPFVRTSPDHGTAFGIAGRGIADPSSLVAALRTAQSMATNRAAFDG
ncbi:MAG: 4-hydroxythreonine-4-phosphate dehydrogenase PdxA [Pseudomonadota bacterium]